MRRILSILLLGLLLYNMVGYSIVYLSEDRYEISKSNEDMVEQVSSTTDIVIKMPVAIPYQTNWDAPEAAEGQIQHQGRFYRMKSRQLLNDTMYVHCEFDQNARDRFSDLVSKITDEVTGQSDDNQNSRHSNLLKNFLKEYMGQGRKHVFFVLEWTPSREVITTYLPVSASETQFSVLFSPPDRA